MNKRVLAILDELITPKGPLTLANLASRNHVSERSVRNYLAEIETLSQYEGAGKVNLLSRTGQVIVPEGFPLTELRKKATDDYYHYHLSAKERRAIAASILVNSTGYVTLQQLADYLCVSRVTIINDLNAIRSIIESGGLLLHSQSNKGLTIEGSEIGRRQFLLTHRLINASFTTGGHLEQHDNASLEHILRKIVNEQEHVHNRMLSEAAFTRTVRYLLICVNRCHCGAYVEAPVAKDIPSDFLELSQDIMKYVSQYCHLTVTQHEQQAFASFLAHQRFSRGTRSGQDILHLQLLTRQFIEVISSELAPALNSDFEFFDNLSSHLSATLSQSNTESNSVLHTVEDIAARHPQTSQSVQRHATIFEAFAHRPLTRIEIDYITVHVCAALERVRNDYMAFRIIVACHAGLGTSKLLMAKLHEHFKFHIVDVVAAHDRKAIEESSADLVIATTPLDECPLPYIVVSPILTDKDYVHLGEKIDELRLHHHVPPRSTPENNMNAEAIMQIISPIAEEMLPEETSAPMLQRMHRAIRRHLLESNGSEQAIFLPELHHLLPAAHILLDAEAHDWREAIEIGSALLLRDKSIESSYVQAMIQTVEKFGPYIVMAPHFALPHATPAAGSKRLAMQFTRLKQPVSFGHPKFDPVSFLCVLSPIDTNTHLKAMFNMISLIKKTAFRKDILAAATSQDAYTRILQHEYLLEP